MFTSLKRRIKLVVLVGSLTVALGVSAYYNAIAPLPPNSITGIVVHKDEGIDVDENGGEVPRYSISIYLFNDDRINGNPSATAPSYAVNKEDFDSARINDVVKGQIIPGSFRGYELADVFEVIPTKDVIERNQEIISK